MQQLPVMEQFYTIQGEGFHQGHAATFIRLAGCNVGCVWCDVKESWDAAKHPLIKVDELVSKSLLDKSDKVVITGGEPLMYNLDLLTQQLMANGKNTHLETSAAYPLSGSWTWICISPKKFKAPLSENLSLANELKVVIYHQSDFEWAEKYAKQVTPDCKLYLQPEWSKAESIIPLIVDYVKQNPQWSIGLQSHKYLQVP